MAAKYRKIDPRLWTDERFVELGPTEKLVAMYILTAQSNRCGLFAISNAMGSEQTGIDPDSYAIAFRKVCDTHHWEYDQTRRVVFIPTWFKYNPPENPKHLTGCLRDLHDLPQTALLERFKANTHHLPESCLEVFRIAMGIAIPIAMQYQEQKQEQKQEQEQKQKQEQSLSPRAGGCEAVAATAGEPLPNTARPRQPLARGGPPAPEPPEPARSTEAFATAAAEDVTDDERSAAYRAFDEWGAMKAPTGRGYPLQAEQSENRKVATLLEVLAQEPPVIHGGRQVPQHRLVPIVVEQLRKSGAKFPPRGVDYATAAVRNRLAEWAASGLSPADPKAASSGRIDYATAAVAKQMAQLPEVMEGVEKMAASLQRKPRGGSHAQ